MAAAAGQVNYEALLARIQGLQGREAELQQAALEMVPAPAARGNQPEQKIVRFADRLFRGFVVGAERGKAKVFYDKGVRGLMTDAYGRGRHKNREKQKKRERETPVTCVRAFVGKLRVYRDHEIPEELKILVVVQRYMEVVSDVKGGCITNKVIVNLTEVLELAEQEVQGRIEQRQAECRARVQAEFEAVKKEVFEEWEDVVHSLRAFHCPRLLPARQMFQLAETQNWLMLEKQFTQEQVPRRIEGVDIRNNFLPVERCSGHLTSIRSFFKVQAIENSEPLDIACGCVFRGFFAKRCATFHTTWKNFPGAGDAVVMEAVSLKVVENFWDPSVKGDLVDFSAFPQVQYIWSKVGNFKTTAGEGTLTALPQDLLDSKDLLQAHFEGFTLEQLTIVRGEIRGYIDDANHFFACSFASALEYFVVCEMEQRGEDGGGGGGEGAAPAAGNEE
ncbi:hypothetical protein K0U07_06090 [bacterium]|nr:hypothetical protein [bacterium]